jgi:hypothetical protein
MFAAVVSRGSDFIRNVLAQMLASTAANPMARPAGA